MMKVLAVGALMLAAGMAAALPSIVPSPNSSNAMYALIEGDVLQVSGGDLSLLGTRTEWLPDGTKVTTPISGYELLEVAKFFTSHAADGTEIVTPDGGIGAGVNDPRLAPVIGRLNWPFCDVASLFSYKFGGGSAITEATGGDLLPVGSGPICGGGYGATQGWERVAFDFAGSSPGCGAAQVMIGTGGTVNPSVGLLGGYICDQAAGSARGNGALFSLNFFGLQFDYFLGGGNIITVGAA